MADEPPLRVTTSRHFLSWLHDSRLSLAFTTYQTNRLFLVGLKANGRLSVFERHFERPMGLFAQDDHLYMSTRYQIWRFENALPRGEEYRGYDRLYVPRVAYTTGDLDVHDLAVDGEGRPVFVNTLYSCLATTSSRYSFRPIWKPPFISRLAPEDRCHLNGLAMAEGRPAYVTTVSRSDVVAGWRERRHTGGCVIDVEDDEIVLKSLSMPHSPRVYRDRLWVLNSGTGELGYVDRRAGRFEPVAFCPGYLRGLAFYGNWALVGLSKQRRERTFSGLALDDRLKEKDTEARCGLWVIDLRTGNVAHWLELEGVVIELYDVAVLPGVRCPMALGFKTDEIHRLITIEEESGPRFEPVRTADDDAAAQAGGTSPPFAAGGAAEKAGAPAPPEYRRANELARAKRYEEAAALYEEGLRVEPLHVNSHVNLGTVLYRLGRREEAQRCWKRALEIDPACVRAHGNLARAANDTGDLRAAVDHWRRVLRIRPDDVESRTELASALASLGRAAEAEKEAREAVRRAPTNARTWNVLGAVLSLAQKHSEALAHFEKAAEVDPTLFVAHLNRGISLEALGDIPGARDAFGRALTLRDEPLLALRRELLCPPVFESSRAIDQYYERVRTVLELFARRGGLRLPLEHVQTSRAEIPFQWAYLGRDDVELRKAYAELFRASFSGVDPADHRPSGPPWRVGFVVTSTHEGVFLRCMGGMLDRLDRKKFRVVVACPHGGESVVRRGLRNPDTEVLALPLRFDHALAVLRDAKLDLAYFWEVGTDATNYFLPFCRIAPVQCTGWGWPVTSAAPELDYHLTSEPLAPPSTERFFCERLVRLPHLPAFMQKPPGVPWRPAPLASFGLPEARRLYLCTQNLRKVHPDMDFLVEGILRGDPGGIVAFVHDTSPLFGELLERRWQRTLGPYRDRLFLVPRQSPDRYTRLLASATVVLDTMYFGGANTAYDAYLARVPVVTLEGAEPRARYTSALHAQAGVEGLTARSPEEYVETAVRVATDPELRSEICERVAQGVERIFEPPEAVRQLETFFEQALGGRGL